MKSSTLVATYLPILMIVYGAIQLFLIDPTEASTPQYYSFNPFAIPVLFSLSVIIALLPLVALRFYLDTRKTNEQESESSIQPPAKSAFRLFMFSSLIFSALATFQHDRVLWGLSLLMFVTPLYADPYIDGRGRQASTKEYGRGIDWNMTSAIIALIALLWTLLTHYGIIR